MTVLPSSRTKPTAPFLNSSECTRRGFNFPGEPMVSTLISFRRMSTDSDQAHQGKIDGMQVVAESRRNAKRGGGRGAPRPELDGQLDRSARRDSKLARGGRGAPRPPP